jgi:hypothetical protein
MSKIFCLQCNKSTQYDYPKPAFCSHCGKSFMASAAAVVPTNSQPPQSKPTTPIFSVSNSQPQNIPSDEDNVVVPKLDKIECTFTVANLRPNRQTGQDVFNEGKRGIDKDHVATPTKNKKVKISNEERRRQEQEVRDNFKKDFFKSSRGSNSIEIQ